MRVVYSAAAYSDLAQIYAWIANDTPRNAKSVIDRICDSIEVALAFAPYMGRRGRAHGTHEWVVRGLPYIVVYRIDDQVDELRVLAIFHGAQNR